MPVTSKEQAPVISAEADPNKKHTQDMVVERLQKKGLRSFDSDSGATLPQLVESATEVESLVDDLNAYVKKSFRLDF